MKFCYFGGITQVTITVKLYLPGGGGVGGGPPKKEINTIVDQSEYTLRSISN